MTTQNISNDASVSPVFNLFDSRAPRTAKKWRPFGRTFFWVTSAIASWMLLARLAELVIGD